MAVQDPFPWAEITSHPVRPVRMKIRKAGEAGQSGGSMPWYFVYPFFMVHMLMFGGSGFLMAYSDDAPDLGFLYMHGGFAIFVYTIFYLAIFGLDKVRWMFINSALGLFGIYAQIDWILSLFGRSADQFAWYVHVIPFLYYVLYTFLLYHFVLFITGADRHPSRKTAVEVAYVAVSLGLYTWLYFRA